MGISSAPSSTPRFAWAIAPLAAVLLICAIAMRFVWLDTVPGINGDEAQAAVEVLKANQGLPHSFRSVAHQFFDPIMLLSEMAEFKIAHPSFLLLRLPAAVWSILGLTLNYFSLRRLYPSRAQALLTTSFLACMPLHLAFSRIGWDPSYLLFSLNFTLFPLLAIAAGRSCPAVWICLLLGTFLCLWVHATSALAIFTLAFSVAVVRRADLGLFIATHLHVQNRPGLGVAFILALLLAASLLFLILLKLTQQQSSTVLHNCLVMAGLLLASPKDALAFVSHLGDSLSGQSVYDDLIGLRSTPTLHALSLILLVVGILLTLRLLFAPNPADRALALFWLLIPLGLVAAASLLNIDLRGNERYLLWSAPLFALLLTRGLASLTPRHNLIPLVTIPLSCLFLSQFVQDFLIAGRFAEYRVTQDLQWTTAPFEPKAAAAAWIASSQIKVTRTFNGPDASATPQVFTENWWLQHPLQLLLGLNYQVTRNELPKSAIHSTYFIVGFTGSDFLIAAARELAAANVSLTVHNIDAGDASPFITIVMVEPR
jgi:hypothetical protein